MGAKLNLNETVLVTLTPCGREMFDRYHRRLGLDPAEYWDPEPDGRLRMELWRVMEVFGAGMSPGISPPISMEVEFVDRTAPAEPLPKTVRVRIAVAVKPNCDWNSYGYYGCSDREAMKEVLRPMPPGSHVVWVEADVPLPAEAAVEGEVKDGP